MKLPNPKKWFRNKIDNYIITHHTKDYVHRSKLKDEIKKHIDNAVEKNNKFRDEQENEKLYAQKVKHEIEVAGWVAELEHSEKITKEMVEKNKRVTRLYYDTIAKTKELSFIVAESKHASTQMMNNFAENIGQIEKIKANTENMVKGIEGTKNKDEIILGVR